ncbi:MAG: hypothetical protein ACKVVP_11315 [Chloroflexota bacterium]
MRLGGATPAAIGVKRFDQPGTVRVGVLFQAAGYLSESGEPVPALDQEKGPFGPSRYGLGGPEGNRTPDLFHAKKAIGGRPLSPILAMIGLIAVPGKPSRVFGRLNEFSRIFAWQAIAFSG